jgi:carboxylesterase type B
MQGYLRYYRIYWCGKTRNMVHDELANFRVTRFALPGRRALRFHKPVLWWGLREPTHCTEDGICWQPSLQSESRRVAYSRTPLRPMILEPSSSLGDL